MKTMVQSRSNTAERPVTGFHHAAALMTLIGSIGVIGGALLFQYVGGLEPCELCLLERWPYYIGIPLLVVAVIGRRRPMVAVSVFTIVALLFLAGTAVAAYHVGVEQHWIAGPTACTDPGTVATSIEELKAQLMALQPVRCDVVQWSLFGVSLAGWNLIASAVFVALCLVGLHTAWRVGSKRWNQGRAEVK